jgi:hypothetical protein
MGKPVSQSKPAALKTDKKDLTGINKEIDLRHPFPADLQDYAPQTHASVGTMPITPQRYLTYESQFPFSVR